MELSIFVVDAFTDTQFRGNSAAVVPLHSWISDELMQNIAYENNLSETAFIKKITSNKFAIRWFSPLTEIDFCGHATLASSFVLYNHYDVKGEIEFTTLEVGSLTVNQLNDNRIEMNFPNQNPEQVNEVPPALLDGLSIKPLQVLKNRQAYFAIFNSVQDVLNVTYQAHLLKTFAPYDLVVTASDASRLSDIDVNNVIESKSKNDNENTAEPIAQASVQSVDINLNTHVADTPVNLVTDYDFVSRYFWPANGGDEDPVTGSIHAGLAPYWAKVLNKNKLHAFQASARGGVLICELRNQRVCVSGHAVLYLQGKIFV
ncbi:PhzF family phenazine biosynthesis protein [uncultured Psychromonas sp.]|uniref:PhzF family phenazine biosynthesis protein n=1 Tax=uncultured Psychromonas sp. TaxID=173974 RepID=UPI002603B831|nr:PhzF family phenazine biosynthesis protein [uncultured Psychromonas sp.]